MIRSLKELFFAALSLAPAVRTTSANGTGVDLQGYGGATLLVIAGTWTDGTHAIALQESDDNSTWTAVAAGDLDGALPTISSSGTASQCYRVGYKGIRRYVRPASTVTGSPSTGAAYAAVIICHEPKKAPK